MTFTAKVILSGMLLVLIPQLLFRLLRSSFSVSCVLILWHLPVYKTERYRSHSNRHQILKELLTVKTKTTTLKINSTVQVYKRLNGFVCQVSYQISDLSQWLQRFHMELTNGKLVLNTVSFDVSALRAFNFVIIWYYNATCGYCIKAAVL